MSCDIQVYTEAKISVFGKERWINVDNWRYNEFFSLYERVSIYNDRCCDLFSYLADVRNDLGYKSFKFDRGLPDDISTPVKKEAEDWKYEAFSYGYCTLEELKNAVKNNPKAICCNKLIEAMEERKNDVFQSFKNDNFEHDKDIRIVFWFDN